MPPRRARITGRWPVDVPPGPLGRCGPIRQCAYLVRDLDAAVAWWAALGVGPFLAMPEQRMQGYVHRGEPVDPELTLAFANSGELQIELIVAHDDAPSPFREALDAGRRGRAPPGLVGRGLGRVGAAAAAARAGSR